MREISIQIQPKRVPGLDLQLALELFRQVGQKSRHIKDSKIKKGPRKQYVNVNFLARNRKKAWADIKKAVFNRRKIGDQIKAASIVICEGDHSWDDYLLLHHFDPSKTTADEADSLCADAYRYLKKAQYRQALPLLQKAAALDNSWAQYNLGFSYQEGQGVRRDIKKAMYWYEKAALNGYDSAQFNLGMLLAMKDQNFRKAVVFYRLAAAQGNINAQYNLGLYYDEGRPGVPKDQRKAFEWYIKAAQGGQCDAQHAVGYLYHEGIGKRRDPVQAIRWYLKAAQKGNMYSMYNLGLSYLSGDGVRQDRPRALKWLQAAAKAGHVKAAQRLKSFLEEGMRKR